MPEITGTTGVVAILGWPVEHSLSPRMHNAAFEEMGEDLCYVAFPVRPEDLREAIAGVRALGIRGLNLTVPHKEAVMALLDKVSPEASFIGAVNTVVAKGTKLEGYNTDGRGFMLSLEEEEIKVKGRRVLVLGSGGAARAVSWYLCDAGAKEVQIHSRNPETSSRLVEDLSINFKNAILMEDIEGPGAMDVIVNATPLGLEDKDSLPLDAGLLDASHDVVDLIYRETPLLKEASARGSRTLDGKGMLLWQGVLASELWTGRRPPVESMRRELLGSLG
jgi:shikimate dehydrogenase